MLECPALIGQTKTLARSRVKICGITRHQDAHLAAALGADAIGINFYQGSPRAVAPDKVAELVQGLPAFTTVVALLVNPDVQEVRDVLASGLIDCLQFHGNETPDFCESFAVPYVKAFRVRDLVSARREIQKFPADGTFILDTYVKDIAGGSGEKFDWSIAATLVSEQHGNIIVAGGLDCSNVVAALEQTEPYGVDVCSGVESSPGVKDAGKLKDFFRQVQNARRSESRTHH